MHDSHLVFRLPSTEAAAIRSLARRRGTTTSVELRRAVRLLNLAVEETPKASTATP